MAEDSRDTFTLKHILSDTINAYYKIEKPTKEKIIAFYKDYWTKNKFSKNTIKSINALGKNEFLVNTNFEVQRLNADTSLNFKSTILYKLNEAGKIVYVGKE